MDDVLKKVIEKSGHNLHFRVAKELRRLGWIVESSYYFVDDLTDKPREIDIVATKEKRKIISRYKTTTTLKSLLFIECKYLTEPTVFWMQEKSLSETKNAVLTCGLNSRDFRDFFASPYGFFDQHHYCAAEKAAKLFASSKEKQAQELSEAILKSAKALSFYRDFKNFEGLYYPVVVYGGQISLTQYNPFPAESSHETKNLIFNLCYAHRNLSGVPRE